MYQDILCEIRNSATAQGPRDALEVEILSTAGGAAIKLYVKLHLRKLTVGK